MLTHVCQRLDKGNMMPSMKRKHTRVRSDCLPKGLGFGLRIASATCVTWDFDKLLNRFLKSPSPFSLADLGSLNSGPLHRILLMRVLSFAHLGLAQTTWRTSCLWIRVKQISALTALHAVAVLNAPTVLTCIAVEPGEHLGNE